MSLDSLSDKNSDNASDKELSSDDVLDILNQEDDKKGDESPDDKEDKDEEIDKDDEDKDDDKDDKDEDSELEDEDKEEDEDELKLDEEELIIPPRKKEILKKYPNFFKDFPQVEAELFRGRQLTEIFPDVDSAKEASEKADTYDAVEEDITKGDITKIIAAVKDSGPDAINRLADDFLDNLGKADPDARMHVISGVIKTAIQAMAVSGRDNEDEDLLNAARQLNHFMFGKKEFEPHKRLSEKNSNEDKLNEERKTWHNERFETAKSEAMDKVKNRIKSVIDVNIDKKNSMTAYIKKNAVNDALNNLDLIMSRDRSFQRTVDGLWQQARKGNLSTEQVGKVVSAYLAKAKSLLPGVIQKAKNEALKGIPGKRANRDRSGRLPINDRDSGNARNKSQKDIPKGMSTYDALNQMMKE